MAQETGGKFTAWNFMICTPQQVQRVIETEGSVSRRISFYEKRAMQMVFVLTRSSTHAVFISALEDLKLSTVCSHTNI
jgi:hypothetical protein